MDDGGPAPALCGFKVASEHQPVQYGGPVQQGPTLLTKSYGSDEAATSRAQNASVVAALPRPHEVIVIPDDDEAEQSPPPLPTLSRNPVPLVDVTEQQQLPPTTPLSKPTSHLKERKNYLATLAGGATPYYRWWASFVSAPRKEQEKYCSEYWPTNEEAFADLQYVSLHWIDFTQTRMTRLAWKFRLEKDNVSDEDWKLFMDVEHWRLKKDRADKIVDLNGFDTRIGKEGGMCHRTARREAKEKKESYGKRVREQSEEVERRKKHCVQTLQSTAGTPLAEEGEPDNFAHAILQGLAEAGCTEDKSSTGNEEESDEFEAVMLQAFEDVGATSGDNQSQRNDEGKREHSNLYIPQDLDFSDSEDPDLWT
jgi:hypothetical protein